MQRWISPECLAINLCISFDLNRLNRVSLAMQGGEGLPVTPTHLSTVKLQHGPINLRQLFQQLIQKIDALDANPALLAASGFDDQVYRSLVMALQPKVFLKEYVAETDGLAAQRISALSAFERYVEEYLLSPLSLTEMEIMLGISARALQYACLKRHGCSPMTYIRNRKLDYAYQQLLHRQGSTKLADLAAELYFSSQSRFTRYFRERFGIKPSELLAGPGNLSDLMPEMR